MRKYKKLMSFGIIFFLALFFVGCETRIESNFNEENISFKDIKMPDIEGYKVSIQNLRNSDDKKIGKITIKEEKGNKEICSLTGEGSDNVNLDINKDKKEIIISPKGKYIDSKGNLNININVPLSYIQIFGGAFSLDIKMQSEKNFYSKFRCAINGNIDIKNADKVDLDFAGAGDLDLIGKAKDFNIECDGAGNIDAEKFYVKNANVKLNGAGNSIVNASERFDGTINGVGSIIYKGDPKSVQKSVNGIGKIDKE